MQGVDGMFCSLRESLFSLHFLLLYSRVEVNGKVEVKRESARPATMDQPDPRTCAHFCNAFSVEGGGGRFGALHMLGSVLALEHL
jgi:hypothetical protein